MCAVADLALLCEKQLVLLPSALHKVQSLSASNYVPCQSVDFPGKREGSIECVYNLSIQGTMLLFTLFLLVISS